MRCTKVQKPSLFIFLCNYNVPTLYKLPEVSHLISTFTIYK